MKFKIVIKFIKFDRIFSKIRSQSFIMKFYSSKRDLVRYQRLNIAYCIVVSNRIYDQPDDCLEKRPKRVVAREVRYVNKALYQ